MANNRTTPSQRSWGALRTMRSGRIQASYVADDGRRYYCPHTFDTRMDGEGCLQNERKLIDRDEWTPPEIRAKAVGYVTLREYTDQWLAHRDLSPKTRAIYGQLLRGRINNHLGDVSQGRANSMGNELALDVNVICLLILSLFFVCLVTALAGPVVAPVSYVGLWLYGLRKGRAEMRRAPRPKRDRLK